MEDQVLDWLGWLVAVMLAIVAIRGTVSFNVNDWLQQRRRQKEENLRLLCPHVSGLEKMENGQTGLRSAYVSPVGTAAHHCENCGAVTHDRDEPIRQLTYWVNHPRELAKRYKRMDKLARKLGRR